MTGTRDMESNPAGKSAPKPILEVRDLTVCYAGRQGILGPPAAEVRAVDGISFHIAPGEILGLVGGSGAGKTTAALAVLRLIKPSAGTVRFEGRDLGCLGAAALRGIRRRMQAIFQDPSGSLDPRMTAGAIIGEGLRIHGIGDRGDRLRRLREALALVGLEADAADRYPHQFSGGQRQRIGIARALILEPRLVVCDEPVSALDVSVQAQILNLLLDLKERLGLTYLLIAHDLAVVERICDRVAVMHLGRIVETGPAAEICRNPGHPRTRALLDAVPSGIPRRRQGT